MPLEVRELVIRANLVGKPSSQDSRIAPEDLKKMREQLLRECRAMVREMMDEKTER